VKSDIISSTRKAQYYSMMFDGFDATPDVSHNEIIRYVHIAGGKCSIEESFIDKIDMQKKLEKD